MRTVLVILLVSMIGLTASAQKNPFKDRIKKAADNREKPKIDLSVEPSTAPVDELDVDEFLMQRKDLVGKVVELEFDRVTGLKQIGSGYSARVSFKDIRGGAGLTLLIPDEGLELFKDYVENDVRYSRRSSVYIEVLPSSMVRAVGERYSKNKPEGERYSW